MRSEKRKMRAIRDPDLSGRGVIVFCCLLGTYGLLAICSCNESLQPRLNRDTSREVGIESGLVSPDLIGEAVRIVEAALADADPQIRVNAIEVVAATRRVELMPKVRRLLRDEFVPVRFAAALAVGDMQYRFARESVESASGGLKDPDENVRIAAAYALVRLGHLDSFGLIRKAIISKDQAVRANAALILGKSGDARQLKLLNWALSDRDSSDKVRFQVAEAMAMLGDEQVYPKLWAMLISAYADDRVMGIKAMGALGTEPAKNALITMLDDKVLEVRLVAAGQLGALGSSLGESEVLDVFRRNLTAGMDADGLERVHMFTALAVGQIRTAAVTEFLPKLLKNQSKRVRIAAAKAVLQYAK
jgi:HEAT repeat protein